MINNQANYDFTGAKALVTGGTSGIGYATASLLKKSGADVTITGTRQASSEYDVDLEGFDYRQLALNDNDAIDALAGTFSELDILINNAGANFPGGLDETTADGFAASVEINLVAPYRLTTALRKALTGSAMPGGASVVSLSSMAAIRATTIVPGYGAGKAGVLSMTRALGMSWVNDGIRVNAVTPGVTATRMTAPMDYFPEAKAEQMSRIPAARFADPEEVAGVIAFLCTQSASYITGAAIVVDGGYSLH